jgi:mRNA interferase MazF
LSIKSGEIWIVNFSPQIGSEIRKERPAVIVNSDIIGKLPLKTVVPITEWKERYKNYPWILKVVPDKNNNLSKVSGFDAFQIKNLSVDRFVKKIGFVKEETLFKIHERVVKTLKPLYNLSK